MRAPILACLVLLAVAGSEGGCRLTFPDQAQQERHEPALNASLLLMPFTENFQQAGPSPFKGEDRKGMGGPQIS